jgi:hypothetical protein
VLKCFHLDPGDDRLVDLLLTVETHGKDNDHSGDGEV